MGYYLDAIADYAQTQPLYERSLAILEKFLGKEHPHVASSLNNFALLYEAQGQYEQAQPLYERSLTICEKVFGKEHPNTQIVAKNYEDFLAAMNSPIRKWWKKVKGWFSTTP